MLTRTTSQLKTQLTTKDVKKLAGYRFAAARENFALFRRAIRPTMKWGWWLQEIAEELEFFLDDLENGRCPKLAIMAPPQHGKSWTVTDYVSWVAGRNPDLKTIFASYSDALGERTNLDTQRTMESETYLNIFPRTRIGLPGWKANTNLIEYCDFAGSFRNTTVKGQVNGMQLHLGIIDDPIKDFEDAMSENSRDKIWNWFTDVFMNRFDANAGLIVVMTRWHEDDLLGRFLLKFPETRVLAAPAIAEIDEIHQGRRYDGTRWKHVRRRGEALFPEWKPMSWLQERRQALTQASWDALFQQAPSPRGGGMFPVDKLRTLEYWDRDQVRKSIRYVDKAGTEGGDGARTAMALMHILRNGQFVISNVEKGRWGALEREMRLKSLVESDMELFPYDYEVWVEQEPGSGGKESAEATIRNIGQLGVACYADKVTGSKEVRAEPFAAQVQGDNVRLVAGAWLHDFISEATSFPTGRYRDQVDAASGAFNKLTAKAPYVLEAFDYA